MDRNSLFYQSPQLLPQPQIFYEQPQPWNQPTTYQYADATQIQQPQTAPAYQLLDLSALPNRDLVLVPAQLPPLQQQQQVIYYEQPKMQYLIAEPSPSTYRAVGLLQVTDPDPATPPQLQPRYIPQNLDGFIEVQLLRQPQQQLTLQPQQPFIYWPKLGAQQPIVVAQQPQQAVVTQLPAANTTYKSPTRLSPPPRLPPQWQQQHKGAPAAIQPPPPPIARRPPEPKFERIPNPQPIPHPFISPRSPAHEPPNLAWRKPHWIPKACRRYVPSAGGTGLCRYLDTCIYVHPSDVTREEWERLVEQYERWSATVAANNRQLSGNVSRPFAASYQHAEVPRRRNVEESSCDSDTDSQQIAAPAKLHPAESQALVRPAPPAAPTIQCQQNDQHWPALTPPNLDVLSIPDTRPRSDGAETDKSEPAIHAFPMVEKAAQRFLGPLMRITTSADTCAGPSSILKNKGSPKRKLFAKVALGRHTCTSRPTSSSATNSTES
ncbi:unnamed protein product, partial [Mesorhabditis spiculigera]